MRSIRRAVLAGATASALLLGGTTVAVANDDTNNPDTTTTTEKEGSSVSNIGRGTSSKIGDKLDADDPANGERLWGSTKNVEKEPKWARIMRVVTIIGVVGSVLGLVVFPLYNFLAYNHILPLPAPVAQ